MLDVIIRFIPNKVKTQIKDRVVDILSEASPDDRWRKLIRSFRSDASFLSAFDAALERAVKRFVAEYEDKELVEALTQSTRFWDLPSVQKALKEVVTRPSSYLTAERDILINTFAEVVPNEPPERVEQAVRFFLHCLAEEVINIPQLFPLYQVQLQKASLYQAREMVAVLRELQADQRQTMTALLETVTQNQLLLPSATQATVPPAPKIYHNLPRPDYSDFVGREQEKKKVISLLSPKKREWVITIDGVGGVGKSALALEVAYHFLNNATSLPKEEQFEAVIWTSAKQTVLTADGIRNRPQVLRTLEDIFTAISITLDREDIIRARVEEQTALAMEALAERRTLLVVDNLETVDDDRLLGFLRELPNPTKAIVTTRHRIDVASPVRLVGMSELEALALIGHLSQEKEVTISDEEARKLYNRTGGLPLAIVWSISLMKFGHSVDSVLARLGSAKSDIIKFSFKSSIDVIKDQDAYKLLLALSLFAKDATREALGYVAGLGEDEISRDDGLVALEKLSLVNKSGDRFSLLQLAETFARAELENDKFLKEKLVERWSLFFQKNFISDYLLLDELQQFDIEAPNMFGYLNWCWDNARFDDFVTFLLQNAEFFFVRGYWSEAEYYLNLAYSQLNVEENNQNLAKVAFQLAFYAYFRGDLTKAESLLLKGVTIFEANKDVENLRRCYRHLTEVNVDAGNVEKARYYLEKAKQVALLTYNPELNLSKLKRYEAQVEMEAGNFDEAYKLLNERIEEYSNIDKDLKGKDILLLCYSLLGRVEIHRGNYENAQKALERALDIAHTYNIKHDTAFVMKNFALLNEAIGNKEATHKSANQALNLYTSLGMKIDIAEVEAIIARCTA